MAVTGRSARPAPGRGCHPAERGADVPEGGRRRRGQQAGDLTEGAHLCADDIVVVRDHCWLPALCADAGGPRSHLPNASSSSVSHCTSTIHVPPSTFGPSHIGSSHPPGGRWCATPSGLRVPGCGAAGAVEDGRGRGI